MAEYVVHQTDERMFFLNAELEGLNAPVETHVYAPNLVLKPSDVTVRNSVIICGKVSDGTLNAAQNANAALFNILEDERFQAVNARLTAEGVLDVIMSHSMLSLDDEKVLIIGFGRTGAAIARLMNKLGVDLTVATSSSTRPARAFGHVIAIGNFDFAPYTAIVNTAPATLIADKEVTTIDKFAVYVDVASKPALSLEFAKYLGLDAEIYPALPAKYAPRAAAMAIKNYILEKGL